MIQTVKCCRLFLKMPAGNSAKLEDRRLSISWGTLPDRIYNVFATDSLASWPSPPARQVSGDGNPATVKVPLAGKRALFLRVEVLVVPP
jgi:hypothetical protein